jgi:hypothetical protein
VCNACDQTPQRGEPLGLNQITLGLAGVECCLGDFSLLPDFGEQAQPEAMRRLSQAEY